METSPPPEPRSHDGVDLTLIDAALRLSPIERIRANDRAAAEVSALQQAFKAYRDRIAASRAR